MSSSSSSLLLLTEAGASSERIGSAGKAGCCVCWAHAHSSRMSTEFQICRTTCSNRSIHLSIYGNLIIIQIYIIKFNTYHFKSTSVDSSLYETSVCFTRAESKDLQTSFEHQAQTHHRRDETPFLQEFEACPTRDGLGQLRPGWQRRRVVRTHRKADN